mgnify:CR=1 FL=1
MNYILTKHAKQRRPHHEIKEDQYLINWLNEFDKKYDFSSLKIGGAYKIYIGYNTAIIKKEQKNSIRLITFRGFKVPIEKFNFKNLKIRETENRDAILKPIYRINYHQKTIKCGTIVKNTKTQDKYRLCLRKNLDKKFIIPDFEEDIYFNIFDEIVQFVSRNKDDEKYYLNTFQRKENY